MNHIQLLDITKTEFANHQSGSRHHYTEKLKNDAVFLLNHYSAPELSRELGVSVQSLRNWKEASAGALPAFLPLSLEEDATHYKVTQSESLILKLPNQLELTFPARSMKDTAQFIACLIREMSTCSI